jgi:hypothetical protein
MEVLLWYDRISSSVEEIAGRADDSDETKR